MSTEQVKSIVSATQKTARVKGLIGAAHMLAQGAANDLTCAASWVGWDDPDEDNRDPAEMLDANLAKAENNAEMALQEIKRIRAIAAAAD